MILKSKLQMWLNENTSETWFQISHDIDVTKHVFLNGEGLQTLISILMLILKIFATYQNVE